MHEFKEKVKKISEMRERLVCLSCEELAKDKSDICTDELGKVIDMVKDLADAEKNCWKACYYQTVIKAMKEAEEIEETMAMDGHDKFGYDHWRYPSSGRFASTGHGARMGMPWMTHDSPMAHGLPYIMESDEVFGYGEDGEEKQMSYDDVLGYRGGRTGAGMGRKMTRPTTRTMGYSDPQMVQEGYDPDYSRTYNRYLQARKHYTQTSSKTDKAEMDAKANEHLMQTVGTMKSMWKDADQDLKAKMKADITALLNDMK